jgi:hypothetical protein
MQNMSRQQSVSAEQGAPSCPHPIFWQPAFIGLFGGS